jgi:hypothetical protein
VGYFAKIIERMAAFDQQKIPNQRRLCLRAPKILPPSPGRSAADFHYPSLAHEAMSLANRSTSPA